MFRRSLLGIAVLGCAALLGAQGAEAASPGQIYRDYAGNGRIDGTYSVAEYRAAQNDALVQGYGNPNVTVGFKGAVATRIAAAGRTAPLAATARTGTLPFTGLDLALLLAGGALLLLLGGLLRLLGRNRV